DDASQQAFIIAAARVESIAAGCERSFLYGIAIRLAATIRRNQRRRRKWVETKPADCASPSGTPLDELERRQALLLLDEVLNRLSDDLRIVFVLSELEELTGPEIAALQGVSPGTVASRLRRARKQFSIQLRRIGAEQLRKTW
ncbi:MAG TPA: RNA polymerase sigma factor, partial [Polyangiaceae bacterium]|nr:RNA polymerase sigma factor [Polyangiaceae bacterium]